MTLFVLTVLMTAQADPAQDQRIYAIPLEDRVVYGTIRERPGGWDIYEDAPWNSERERKHLLADPNHDLIFTFEAPSARPARLAEEAKKAGFIEVAGRYVPVEEAQLAQRAADMIAAVRAAEAAPSAETAAAPEPNAGAGAPTEPGLISQWGLHAGIVAVALALMALVLRFAILA